MHVGRKGERALFVSVDMLSNCASPAVAHCNFSLLAIDLPACFHAQSGAGGECPARPREAAIDVIRDVLDRSRCRVEPDGAADGRRLARGSGRRNAAIVGDEVVLLDHVFLQSEPVREAGDAQVVDAQHRAVVVQWTETDLLDLLRTAMLQVHDPAARYSQRARLRRHEFRAVPS